MAGEEGETFGSPTECTTATTVYPRSTVRLCAQQESRGREGTRLELCNRSFFLSCCCCALSFRSKIMGLAGKGTVVSRLENGKPKVALSLSEEERKTVGRG